MANGKHRKIGLLICTILFLWSGVAVADARTDYLVKMLENGGSYRVRVQAATTLGKLRSKPAVPALKKALHDENNLVVISVVAALGQIGDVSAIPDLKKALKRAVIADEEPEEKSTDTDIAEPTEFGAVISQIESTIRVLKALDKGSEDSPRVVLKPRFYIHVDSMGNSSGVGHKGILDSFKNMVEKSVKRESDVVMQASGLSNKAVKKLIEKDKLDGYVLSGSIISLEKEDHQVTIKIGLNVLSNPGYSLLMMPTIGGIVPVSTNDSDQVAYEKAIKAVVDKLVKTVFNKLRQM